MHVLVLIILLKLLFFSKTDVVEIPRNCTLYREVVVTNPTDETKDEVELFVFLNTKKLLDEDKITRSCVDEIHILEDGVLNVNTSSAFIPYWMENSCGHQNTKFWFKLQNLTAREERKLFIYYNCNNFNSTVSNPFIEFDPDFIVMHAGGCPSSFQRFSEVDDKLLKSSTMYETDSSQPKEHLHNFNLETLQTYVYTSEYSSDQYWTARYHHTHKILKATPLKQAYWPEYSVVNFCRGSKLDVLKDSIFMFNSPTALLFPEGFERVSELDGKFIRGGTNIFFEGGQNTHSHSFDFLTERTISPSSQMRLRDRGDQHISTHDHTHQFHGTTLDADIRPPFYSFLFGRNIYDYNFVSEAGFIVFSLTTPPFGYVPYVDESVTKFIVGGDSKGVTGGIRKHLHGLDSFVLEPENSYHSIGGDCHSSCYGLAYPGHLHSFQVELEEMFTLDTTLSFPFIGIPQYIHNPPEVDVFVGLERSIYDEAPDVDDDTQPQVDDDSGGDDDDDTGGVTFDYVPSVLGIVFGSIGGICCFLIFLIILPIGIGTSIYYCISLKKKKKKDEEVVELKKEVENFYILEEEAEKKKKIKTTLKVISDEEIEFEDQKPENGFLNIVEHNGEWNKIRCVIITFDGEFDDQLKDNFQSDMQKYYVMNHPNVLKVHAITLNPNLNLIVERYETNIKAYFEQKVLKKKFTSTNTKLKYLVEILNGLSFLHDNGYLHGNLSSSRILLTRDFIPKAKIYPKFSSFPMDVNKSWYCAPEVVLGGKERDDFDQYITDKIEDELCKRDVFSFGMIAIEVLTENFDLFQGVDNPGIKIAQDPNYRPNLSDVDPSQFPSWMVDLLKKILSNDLEQRPTCNELQEIFDDIKESIL